MLYLPIFHRFDKAEQAFGDVIGLIGDVQVTQ
jgi:hypothetical protein